MWVRVCVCVCVCVYVCVCGFTVAALWGRWYVKTPTMCGPNGIWGLTLTSPHFFFIFWLSVGTSSFPPKISMVPILVPKYDIFDTPINIFTPNAKLFKLWSYVWPLTLDVELCLIRRHSTQQSKKNGRRLNRTRWGMSNYLSSYLFKLTLNQ